MRFSFICTQTEDFIKNHDGKVLIIVKESREAANQWFVDQAERLGKLGVSVYGWCWDE